MYIFPILCFIVAALFLVLGILIYRGNTDMITGYHQEAVTDKAAYGKAYGRVYLSISPMFAASGILHLVGHILIACVLCLLSIAVLLVWLSKVQEKYNGRF